MRWRRTTEDRNCPGSAHQNICNTQTIPIAKVSTVHAVQAVLRAADDVGRACLRWGALPPLNRSGAPPLSSIADPKRAVEGSNRAPDLARRSTRPRLREGWYTRGPEPILPSSSFCALRLSLIPTIRRVSLTTHRSFRDLAPRALIPGRQVYKCASDFSSL